MLDNFGTMHSAETYTGSNTTVIFFVVFDSEGNSRVNFK
ncbi:hypothetical protein 2050HW_00167 [Serratia phage vB_SmaM_ 2050HW]|uniref:Uncharacterized protein n=1 Tax=Serratia phage vB_SmaM_ 2050HW TaxID=2024252 RepID=A0A289ZIK4_9CAUD|nr:hypothetical protein HWB23_gp167 [Serratia phage vB_SmaM_ 2050HW]ATA65502.1 hypothetical protein 2050HW_00167 [Serratia phage vB_SmaM_ 2050HW]